MPLHARAAAATLAAAFLVSAPAVAQDVGVTPVPVPAPATVPDAAGFVAAAASSGLLEIRASRLALDRAMSGDVAGFARTLISDHEAAAARLRDAVAAAGADLGPPPDELLPADAEVLADLAARDGGKSFEAAWLMVQVAAHEKAVALHEAYARAGDVPALVDYAATTAPLLRAHLDTAVDLGRKR